MEKLLYHRLAEKAYKMESLNKLELDILKRLSKQYSYLSSHIPFLFVKNREYTGVGIYINFGYLQHVPKLPVTEINLGNSEIINITPALKNGLVYELDIKDGKINFIELVTIGEQWDGMFDNYFFSE